MKRSKTAIGAGAGIAGALIAAVAGAGYYMYRNAVVRDEKRQHNYWREPIEKGDYDMSDAFLEIVRDGERFFRGKGIQLVSIRSTDGLKLAGHVIEHPEPRGAAILVHGYRSHPLIDFSALGRALYDRGMTLLLIDQRTHSDSEGTQIGYGALERYDVVEWAKYAEQRWPDLPVLMGGVSMGSATVMMGCGVGYPANVKAILADCGYTTPGAICRRKLKDWYHLPAFPVYYAAKAWTRSLAHYNMDAVSAADALKALKTYDHPVSVLLVHGTGDDFVPYEMSVENRAAFDEDDPSVEFLSVEGAAHAQSFLTDRVAYLDALDRLLERAGI